MQLIPIVRISTLLDPSQDGWQYALCDAATATADKKGKLYWRGVNAS
jgi:hypothetical protein